MKRTRLLNSELSYEIARIGHTASITLCDAGLHSFNSQPQAYSMPTLIKNLEVLLSEMMVEEIIIASEIHEKNEPIFQMLLSVFEQHRMQSRVTEVPHEEFKRLTGESRVIVRTGECTPYANVILKSGVVF
ncbi:MAG: D-ribose pyranase [Pirellulaceae bacterium]|nr:D-ribose pyranase [Pirellulaceae bacterium]